jgi:lysophospholipase L1-like esterase
MTTFTALGDSITLGVGDPVRDANGRRAWRGWAALLADGLVDAELHVLAANGACASQIERDQLPRALGLRPDLASVIFGINDTLRPSFDQELIARSAAHTVGALRAAGAEVLTMRLPDAGQMLGLPGALSRPLARRTQQVNAVLDDVAARFGTLHFDAAATPETYRRQMWAVDRLHPNERGHRMIARSFHGLLAGAGYRLGAVPSPEPANAPPTKLAEVCWIATKGTAWVVRRSTDLVPYLVAMAIAELAGSVPFRPVLVRSVLARSGRWPRVGAEPPEQLAERGDVLVGDAVAQSVVEGDGRGAEIAEHVVAAAGEPDDMDTPVRRITVPAEQPGVLHRVEMVRQGGFPDPDRIG